MAIDAARSEVRKQISPDYSGIEELAPYTRNSQNEIDNLFPILPDLQLVMYVYPHLAGDDQVPVPGYSTAFPLYERVHYALPGEV